MTGVKETINLRDLIGSTVMMRAQKLMKGDSSFKTIMSHGQTPEEWLAVLYRLMLSEEIKRLLSPLHFVHYFIKYCTVLYKFCTVNLSCFFSIS